MHSLVETSNYMVNTHNGSEILSDVNSARCPDYF